MRLIIILPVLYFFNFSLYAQQLNEQIKHLPIINFTEDEVNLGEAMEGEVLEYTCRFVNDGKETLIISNVLTSCGCTIVDWSRKPIFPSEAGEIKIKFDTENKIGIQSKSIIILSNSIKEKDEIKLIANVIPRSEAKVSP